MRLEHHEKVIKQAEREEAARQEAARQAEKEKQQPKKQYGFIAVSMGDGLKEFFTELGVDYVIEGGQTMNPSTEDMLNAIEKVHAENIFIFPNNKMLFLQPIRQPAYVKIRISSSLQRQMRHRVSVQ